MATLKELYTTLKSLRDMNLPIDDKLLKAADNLEEKIIKEEILPALSQNIEPQLNEIQRDLVLVVEYHPGEPLHVALSRTVKISEIIDAKPLTLKPSIPVSNAESFEPTDSHEPTKHIENPTRGLRVTFPDGTVICRETAIHTFVDVLQKIGLDRIPQVGIEHGGYNLVGKDRRPTAAGRVWQHEVDGWYVYSNISNEIKTGDLKRISDFYNLALLVEEGKKSKDGQSGIIEADDTTHSSMSKFHEQRTDMNELYEHLVKLEGGPADKEKGLHVCDSIFCRSFIVKRGRKYGLFCGAGISIYGDLLEERWGIKDPFIYDDVRIACESSCSISDLGIVAVKKEGKWGMIDVTPEYEMQEIVAIEHSSLEEALDSLTQVIGRKMVTKWCTMEEYDPDTLTPYHNEKGDFEISERNINDAEHHNLRISIDNKFFEEKNAIQTFIMALQYIGLDEVAKVGIKCSGYNLVDSFQRTDGKQQWQQYVDGKWVYIYFSNPTKCRYLFEIGKQLHRNIKIEAIAK